MFLVVVLLGCGNQENRTPATDSRNGNPPDNPTDRCPDAPFEYKLVSKQEMQHAWGPQVVLDLETTNEVARNVTKDDLSELWQQMGPVLGDQRVFLSLRTPVPGAGPWAVISRIKTDGEWEVNITMYPSGIDAEPYHFVNEIDRSVANQRAMLVTLPMVNRLNEQLVRRGWTVKERTESFYSAESRRGIQSVSITLTPESIDIHAVFADGNMFSDAVDLVFTDLRVDAVKAVKAETPGPIPVSPWGASMDAATASNEEEDAFHRSKVKTPGPLPVSPWGAPMDAATENDEKEDVFQHLTEVATAGGDTADELKQELFSVIGSPDYLRAAPGKPAQWTWTFGKMEVTYVRLPQIDNLSARYAD